MTERLTRAGAAPTILFLHGFTGRGSDWDALVDALAAFAPAARVVAPDLPGHGPCPAPRSWEEAVATAAGRVLDLPRPRVVVGYSMGARLALAVLAAHPGVADKAILISPTAGLEDDEARGLRLLGDRRLADDLRRDGLQPFLRRWEEQPLIRTQERTPEPYRTRMGAARNGHDKEALAAALEAMSTGAMPPLFAQLGAIVTPTLLIHGAEDHKFAASAAVMARALPDARVVVIEGAGHAPQLENPADVALCVAEFLGVG